MPPSPLAVKRSTSAHGSRLLYGRALPAPAASCGASASAAAIASASEAMRRGWLGGAGSRSCRLAPAAPVPKGRVIAFQPAHGTVSRKLHRADQRHEDRYHHRHHRGVEALVAVADRHVAEPTGSDRARHRRGADHRNKSDREPADDARQRLRAEDVAQDLAAAAAGKSRTNWCHTGKNGSCLLYTSGCWDIQASSYLHYLLWEPFMVMPCESDRQPLNAVTVSVIYHLGLGWGQSILQIG